MEVIPERIDQQRILRHTPRRVRHSVQIARGLPVPDVIVRADISGLALNADIGGGRDVVEYPGRRDAFSDVNAAIAIAGKCIAYVAIVLGSLAIQYPIRTCEKDYVLLDDVMVAAYVDSVIIEVMEVASRDQAGVTVQPDPVALGIRDLEIFDNHVIAGGDNDRVVGIVHVDNRTPLGGPSISHLEIGHTRGLEVHRLGQGVVACKNIDGIALCQNVLVVPIVDRSPRSRRRETVVAIVSELRDVVIGRRAVVVLERPHIRGQPVVRIAEVRTPIYRGRVAFKVEVPVARGNEVGVGRYAAAVVRGASGIVVDIAPDVVVHVDVVAVSVYAFIVADDDVVYESGVFLMEVKAAPVVLVNGVIEVVIVICSAFVLEAAII